MKEADTKDNCNIPGNLSLSGKKDAIDINDGDTKNPDQNYNILHDIEKQKCEERRYDESAKNFFRKKVVMAKILKYFVPEFKEMSRDEIQSCFIKSGDADSDVNLVLENVESSPVGEKEVDYDLKFRVRNPQADGKYIMMCLIMDFEVQNRYHPGYSLKKRGVYYCSRMISEQLPETGEDRGYDRLEKVYSIWLVTDVPKRQVNTIQTYTLKDQNGNTEAECDLVSLNFININISHKYQGRDHRFQFLYAIFADDDKELKDLFDETEYSQMKEAKERMGKPHEALRSAYMTAGMEQGIQQGLKQGMKQGIQRGMLLTIDALNEAGLPEREAVRKAAIKYGKPEREVMQLYKEQRQS